MKLLFPGDGVARERFADLSPLLGKPGGLIPEKDGAQVKTTFWKSRPDPRPPGHCDPVAARVASRYARRSLQFDFRAVGQLGQQLAEDAIDRLMKTVPKETGIEWELDRESIIVTGTLELPDVRGRQKRLTIVVSHRSGNQGSPTAGGHFEPETSTVRLFLNSRWSPEALSAERNKVMGAFQSFLVHEVTHALDVLPEGAYEGAEGDKATYFNQPAEFRAYTKQIVADVLNRFKMTLRINRGKGSTALVEAALEGSQNYQKVKGYFDRRNHQRLRQVVVRELETAGLLPSV